MDELKAEVISEQHLMLAGMEDLLWGVTSNTRPCRAGITKTELHAFLRKVLQFCQGYSNTISFDINRLGHVLPFKTRTLNESAWLIGVVDSATIVKCN